MQSLSQSSYIMMQIVALGVALVLLHFLFFNRRSSSSSRRRRNGCWEPKGSMGWPFIGETIPFMAPHSPYSLGDYLQRHCHRYGKVFKSHIFGCPTIISCHPDLNNFILHNEEKLFRGSYPKVMHSILGPLSLLIATGDLHRKLRSHVVRFTYSAKSNPLYPHFVHHLCHSTMRSWEALDHLLFHHQSRKFLFNLTVKQVLSIEPDDPVASLILDHFLSYMKGFVSTPLPLPGTAYSKAVKARGGIVSILKRIMEERRSAEYTKTGDLLDILLSSDSNSNNSADQRLSDDEIVSVVMDFLLGGYETTSTLLSLAVYFVGKSPLILQHLKAEQEAIKKGKGPGEPLDWEDFKKMTFTSYVISETLRCGNVVKLVHRQALVDVEYKGYRIPAGWKVFPILTAQHLDPLLHENPTDFNPWRWQDPKTSKNVSPFGGGVRFCPGYELGKLHTAFFLHHLVLNYRWNLKEDPPLAFPYVDFPKGLPMEIDSIIN